MADQVRHDVYNQIQQGEYWSIKRKTGSEIETGFSLSYEGLEPSTHALKGRCSTN